MTLSLSRRAALRLFFFATLVGVSRGAEVAGFPPPTVPAAATTLAELRAQLAAHLGQARFNGASWGVKISSLESGQTVFEHHADRLLSPASNSKLYTGALALDLLGADYRIVTPLYATVKPDGAGNIDGDLIIVGRGDPSWKSKNRRDDFWDIFAPFVAALKKAGVRRVAGDIVADATFFRGPASGAGWTVDDLNDDYGAEISALTLEENFADVRVVPGAAVGARCELTLLHPQTGLVLENRTTTIAKGGVRRVEARRNVGESTTYIFGELPLGDKEEILDVTVPRPAQWFAAALKAALIRSGILVDGAPRSVRWPESTAVTATAFKLGELESPPMRELVAAFMKPSQNLETDLIFGHVGETLRAADYFKQADTASPAVAASLAAARTSENAGVVVLREFLRKHGLPVDDVRFEEGSGLSRNNLTTARATLALLQVMAKHRDAKDFFDALPIAGVDGTLRRRLRGTAAEGNLRAKTGTLRWANALSGYVTSAAGERLVLSVIVNRNVVPTGKFARDDVDAIALMLARFAGRSAEPGKP